MFSFQMEAQKEAEIVAVSVLELFRNVDYRKPLLISVILQFSQQLSGIGGVSQTYDKFEESKLLYNLHGSSSCKSKNHGMLFFK